MPPRFEMPQLRATSVAKKGRPQPIGEILAELITARGYGQVMSANSFADAWATAAGEFFAQHTRPGNLRRGTLEVMVTNSTLVQELGFQKQDLLTKLRELLPEEKIKDLRFRVGRIE